MEKWRLLDLGVTDSYDRVVIREVLSIAMKKMALPTLYFCVPKRHVWVGPRANVKRQVDLEYCRKEGIPVVRDILGGHGVAVSDGDILHYCLVSDLTIHDISLSSQLCMNCVVKGLQFMGLEAELKPRSNDVLVEGKKVSGNGFRILHGFYIFAGTVIVDFNYDFCERTTLPVPELFAKKEAKSHREWVTTLKTELGRDVSFSEVVSALKGGFETVLQVEFEVVDSLTEAEEQILEELQEKYRSEEWTKYGKWSPVKEY